MITSIGYDPNISTLEIEFKSSGEIWQYYDFPSYLFEEMMNAESKGKFFNANVKKKFPEARVG
ncbi:MAG: KTSC domain-containing protein [Anaerolineaceae bacterium]|nr:KTSC domain-containing protein [Anaerolineaceae bacterium]